MNTRFLALGILLTLVGLVGCGDDSASQPATMALDSGIEGHEPQLATCAEPLLVCGDDCIDPRFDPEHCGGCDERCETGSFCDDGQCVARCGENGVMCEGSCVDTETAHEHCGGCGEACADDEQCRAGACEGNEDEPDPTEEPETEKGPCCEGRLEGGCETTEIEACVCAADEFCCTAAWDEVCVALVTSEGCGSCGGSDPNAACEPSESADTLPATLAATLDGTANNIETSCGSAAESEVVFAYTAELAGTYSFETQGSMISDTVLAVLDGGACDDAELACNDDDGDRLTSKLTLDLSAGQEILLVVESWGSEQGDVEVSVSAGSSVGPIECTPSALSMQAPVTGAVSAGASGLEPSCAVSSKGEVLYEFTAPAAGRYRFDTSGSTADTILQVLDADCEGSELACNDDSAAGGLAAIVDVELSADQTVLVNLDSYDGEGDYTFSVALATDVVDATGCCVEHESASCDDAAIAACVCADDDYCCTNAWDVLCVYAVEDLDCGGC